jgi:hypothetical protein
MLMDFLIPPKGDEDGPFVGRLQVLFFGGGEGCMCAREGVFVCARVYVNVCVCARACMSA